MHRQERYSETRSLGYSLFKRFRHVVIFVVEKHLFAAGNKGLDQVFHAWRKLESQANFKEAHNAL